MMAQDLPVVAATAVSSEAELAKLDVVVWLYVKKGFQHFAEEDRCHVVISECDLMVAAKSCSGGSNSRKLHLDY
jgi:hypothetical protein